MKLQGKIFWRFLSPWGSPGSPGLVVGASSRDSALEDARALVTQSAGQLSQE